jgi:Uma2 family endonuclease
MSANLEPRRFNVTEFYQMLEAGILTPDDRVELIEGRVINLDRNECRHAACRARLSGLLYNMLDNKVIVSTQHPVRLNDLSEPIPDLALLKDRADFYAAGHPEPTDVLIIIEVADTSLQKDREIKIPLYASSGISEAWLINLQDSEVEVFWEPAKGKYRLCRRLARGQVLSSPTVQGLSLNVSEILPSLA